MMALSGTEALRHSSVGNCVCMRKAAGTGMKGEGTSLMLVPSWKSKSENIVNLRRGKWEVV